MASARKPSARSSHYGRLVDDESVLTVPQGLPPGTTARAVKWVPDRRKNKEVPAGFELRLLIVEDAEGLRHVFPRGGDQDFLIQASAGGRGILFDLKQPDNDVKETYRLMHLLFQGSFNERRMMARRFFNQEDLSLTRTERAGDSVRHILPEIMLPGSSQLLTPNRLLEIGLAAAKNEGVPKLDTAKIIEAGLLEIARQHVHAGITLRSSETAAVLRIALLGTDVGNRPSDATTVELIEGRVFDAVRKHRQCPLEEFERFLWKDVDNLVQQLGKRKPPVHRPEVQYVLNQLLWQSFLYVSQCVAMQMQAVRSVIDPPLSEEERRLYGHRYELQAHLGGVAPVLLNSRLGFTCATWDHLATLEAGTESQAWNALGQALYWHNEMVANRREADVRQKSQQAKCAVIVRQSRSIRSNKRPPRKKPLPE